MRIKQLVLQDQSLRSLYARVQASAPGVLDVRDTRASPSFRAPPRSPALQALPWQRRGAGMLEAELAAGLAPLCGGGSGALSPLPATPSLPGSKPQDGGGGKMWGGEGAGRRGEGQGEAQGRGRLRPPAAPALKFHGRCSSYKDDAGCARGTRGREAADEYGEEFAMGGACRGSPSSAL